MTLLELQDNITAYAIAYFSGAVVVWGQQSAPKPKTTMVMLKINYVNSSTFAETMIDSDGEIHYQYPSKAILEVNLFTNGRVAHPPTIPQGETVPSPAYSARINTAVNDLLEFVKYLKSPKTIDWAKSLNIAIMPLESGGAVVNDVSGILNEASFEYRAMAEFEISFVTETQGIGGNAIQSDSGGGGGDTSGSAGWFNKININKKEGE